MKKTMVELFAGVGGFRVGIEKADNKWETVFANQWEPSKKTQFAFNCYKHHFQQYGGITEWSNCDITKVPNEAIPNHTLLVGGFPCQDYSVASTGTKGIQGKKGVLWWEIERIAKAKQPPFILLENVDRLLKSPSKQRGRDFGVILACLNNLDYGVEWRVIRASDYGFAQRRKRIFIFAFHKTTQYYKKLKENSIENILSFKGIFAKVFEIEPINTYNSFEITENLQKVSDEFKFDFKNTGILLNGKIHTIDTTPILNSSITLKEILEEKPSEKYYISNSDLESWKYMKGAKEIKRISKEGYEYIFREGAIAFPDYLDRPARTMLTSEASKNRSSHIILDPNTQQLRKITPLECERINGFPDNWTGVANLTDSQRYFCMGNALVIGIITKITKELSKIIENE